MTRTMPAPAVMAAEMRHLRELLAMELLRERDIDLSLGRIRAALVAHVTGAARPEPNPAALTPASLPDGAL